MPSSDALVQILARIDGRGYRAYQDLRGRYAFPDLELFVDHVQGDPFAAPSRLRVRLPMRQAMLPTALWENPLRRLGLSDFLARVASEEVAHRDPARTGSGRSGTIRIDAGGQEILERSAVAIEPESVELRLEAGLPAQGRRILGTAARQLLAETIPDVARAALRWDRLDDAAAQAFVSCLENQEHIRDQLAALGLVAFVANGSLLPRESGASDRPLAQEKAVRFQSPPSLEVRVQVPNPIDGCEEVTGMGIPRGVTLIVGGGYHGKSTLLRALERGVYPHVPGDGRELVVADRSLVKLRAEDGRRIERVDIRGFIGSLPASSASDPRNFQADNASGSTSQAAAIVEAIEAGATGLLLDEDTSATNFMLRDARMQALVDKEHEPITPFVDRVRELYEGLGVSTVLVMGSSGDYFEQADHVVQMQDYQPLEVSEEARRIAGERQTGRACEAEQPLAASVPRVPDPASFDPSRGRRRVKIDAPELQRILYGRESIDLRAVEQLVDRSQTRAIGLAIHLASTRFMQNGQTLAAVLDALDALLDESGLDALGRYNLARPRRFELAAAINRLRSLRID